MSVKRTIGIWTGKLAIIGHDGRGFFCLLSDNDSTTRQFLISFAISVNFLPVYHKTQIVFFNKIFFKKYISISLDKSWPKELRKFESTRMGAFEMEGVYAFGSGKGSFIFYFFGNSSAFGMDNPSINSWGDNTHIH